MPSSIVDFLTAPVPAPVVAHLSDASPLPHPLDLSLIREASFAGYSPCVATIYSVGADPSGLAWINGQANFLNATGLRSISPTAIYFTAQTPTAVLIAFLPLDGTPLRVIPVGAFVVDFSVLSFVAPTA